MYEKNPNDDATPLGIYVGEELEKISDAFRTNLVDNIEFKIWNVLPDKPRTGQAYYADGTNWNPGTGEGLYVYLSSSAWSKL